MQKQAKITATWLRARGYTVAAAARAVRRSRQHVNEVLTGKRQSPPLVAKLSALPKRVFVMRERITSHRKGATA